MNVRLIAARALAKTENDGYSNLVLKNLIPAEASATEAAQCTAMFYGTVSRIITLDYILARCVSRPFDKLDVELRAILRLGLYQAKYMDSVRIETAVDESVKLARLMKKSSAAGLVNAALRKASTLELSTLAANEDDAGRLSVKYSVSRSIAQLFLRQHGRELAGKLLEATLAPPKTFLRVNTLRITTEEAIKQLAAVGVDALKSELDGALEASSLYGVLRSPLMNNGLVRVQGLYSQYAAAALGAQEGETVFDMCAAPGGKSLTIAQHMRNRGRIVSLDASERRLSLIAQTAKKEGVSIIETRVNDASVFDPSLGEADRVLCDVPCSNLGVMSGKPEIRLRDVSATDSLAALQLAILNASARYVRRGGTLVYSTCTINRDENQGVCDAFLRGNAEFAAIAPKILDRFRHNGEEFTEILPNCSNSSGFYVATFKRMC